MLQYFMGKQDVLWRIVTTCNLYVVIQVLIQLKESIFIGKQDVLWRIVTTCNLYVVIQVLIQLKESIFIGKQDVLWWIVTTCNLYVVIEVSEKYILPVLSIEIGLGNILTHSSLVI